MAVKTFEVELKDKISSNAKNASDQVKGLVSQMGALEKAATRAAALGDAGALEKAASKYRMLATEVNRLGSEFPGAAVKADGLGAALESFGLSPAAMVEVASVAVLALGAALVATVGYAIEASEAADRMSASFAALGGVGTEGGKAILGAVRDVAAGLPQSEREVQKWAQTLMAAGVTDMTKLKGSLVAVAGAEALVEGGGEKVKNVLAKLAEQSEAGTKTKFSLASLVGTGVNESEFLKALGMTPANFAAAKKAGTITGAQISEAITKSITAKSAGPLNEMNNELGTVFTKGKDKITHLFEGLDFTTVGEAAAQFFNVFDLANPSGQAIKAGIGAVVTWVGEKLVWAATAGRHLFLELELGALLAYNYLRPLVHGFLEWGESSGFLAGALDGVKYVAMGLGVAAAAVVVVLGALAVVATGVVTGIAYLIGKIPDGIAAVIAFVAAVPGALADFAKAGWNAAVDFVAGMVKGLVDGATRIVGAAEGLAGKALDSVKNTLGIHSPSLVMQHMGGHAAEGFAQGIEGGTDRVQDASAQMAGAPLSSATPQSGSSTSTTNHYEIHITAKDNATAHELVGLFEETMASIQERRALSQGVAMR